MNTSLTLQFGFNLNNPATARALGDYSRLKMICFQKIPGYGCDQVPFERVSQGIKVLPFTGTFSRSVQYLIELFGYLEGSAEPIPLVLKTVNQQEIPSLSQLPGGNGFALQVPITGSDWKFVSTDDTQTYPVTP